MVATPRVSIGMPVYNGENYLSEAVECLLQQTFRDYELIISDNASSDRTQEICERYAAQDNRIRYIRQPDNIGAIGNFNFVFQQSRGEFFKWASHDDLCEPAYLESCLGQLQSNPDLVWCHCDSDMVDAEGNSWLQRLPEDDEEVLQHSDGQRSWKGLPRQDHQHSSPRRRFQGVLLGTRWCVDSYGLIRADMLRQTRLLVDLYGAEKVLMGELSLLGPSFQVPELLFKQRIHREASSYQDDRNAQQQFASAREAKPFASTRLSLLTAHLGAIRHSKLSMGQRIGCYCVVVRYLLQFRKWGRVFARVFGNHGVGGGGRRIIESASKTGGDD